MRISGLNSGLDIEQIVSDLVRAQRIPLDRVYQQKVKTEWKRDAYREVNSKLLRFRNLVFDLTLEGTFLKKSAASSRPDLLTATASGAATEGTWEIVVKKLASAARQVSELPEDLPGGFSFVIGTSPEKLATITIEDGDGLEQIAAKINKAQVGINAFAHDGQMSLTTTATGQDAAIYVDQAFTELFGGELGALAQVPGEDGEPPMVGVWTVEGQAVRGSDAEVVINGVEATYGSNTFQFNGITVNLLNAEAGAAVTVEVKPDVDSVVEKVKEFVNLYNELVGELNRLLREEVYRDFPPLTQEQKDAMSDKEIELWEEKAKSGLLRSDSLLSSILSEMRMALGAAVERSGGAVSLRQMGITTGAWYEYGRLYLDENKLRSALTEDPDAVRELFTQQGGEGKTAGIARRLTEVLDRGMQRITDTAGKATIPYDQSYLGNRIREYESRLEAMEERLRRFEEAQWRKFTAMEKALGQLYAQSDWLYQQLLAMQG